MPIVDARVIVVWATQGQTAVNTADIEYDDANATPLGIAELIRLELEANVLPVLSADAELREVKVGDDVMGGIATSSAVGGIPDSPLPPNCALGVTKAVQTGRNGRWFVPGVPEQEVGGNGNLKTTYINQCNNAFATFFTNTNGGLFSWKVRQKDLSLADVQALTIRPFITRQGRRLDRARGF